MSGEILAVNSVLLLILFFVFYQLLFYSRDVKFAFLNLFRHKRRSFFYYNRHCIGWRGNFFIWRIY